MTDDEMYKAVNYLPHHFASRHRFYGFDYDEIYSTAMLGIANGIVRYKERPVGDWPGYAWRQCRSAISSLVSKRKALRRIPKHLVDSLDAPIELEESEASLHDVVPCNKSMSAYERIDLYDMLAFAISRLQSQRSIKLINALLMGKNMEEASKVLGCSLMSAWSLYYKTIGHLQKVWKAELNSGVA